MKKFTQLSLQEREKLYIARKAGKSMREIASILERSTSTISRELMRNTSNISIGYLPDRANAAAKDRRRSYIPKIEYWPELKEYVMQKLSKRWSPEIIAGRWKREKNIEVSVCMETIYRYIYGKEGSHMGLYRLLAKARPKRGMLYKRTPRSSGIPNRISIHDRPQIVDTRDEVGHFEGDLTFLHGNQSGNIGIVIERKSRFVLLHKNNSKATKEVISGMIEMLTTIPFQIRKSITFDNGREFFKHRVLKEQLDMDTFFCDKHAPWQKGQVENANVLLHRYINKKTCFEYVTNDLLKWVQDEMNNLPRKCLGFRTPTEVIREGFS